MYYSIFFNAEKLEACKLLKSLMDEIVKDCNMARQLQKQTMELMKSVDGKKNCLENILNDQVNYMFSSHR